MAINIWSDEQYPEWAPARNAVAVTPSDSVDLTYTARYLFVGGAGNLSVIMDSGTTVAFNGVTAGSVLPIRAARVRATGTTATNIVAMW